MGCGDYLSTTAEQNYAANEQKLADWDVERDLHAQVLNMVEVYEMHGMEKTDAEEVRLSVALTFSMTFADIHNLFGSSLLYATERHLGY